MRQAIGHRQSEFSTPPRLRVDLPTFHTPKTSSCHGLDDMLVDADRHLTSAISNQDRLQTELKRLATTFREVRAHLVDSKKSFAHPIRQRTNELERAKQELANAKRQTEVVKSLLVDATTEKEIMYEAFNEELDGMYNDINLPDDEAWGALTKDLRKTKEARNVLNKENS